MFVNFYIILSLCVLNCVLVNGGCDSLFECVGTFFNDFTNISTNSTEINGTKISVIDFGNVNGTDQIIEDLKHLKNETKIKTQNSDILAFDLSKYLNESLKTAADWFTITQVEDSKTKEEIKDNMKTDFLSIHQNITEEINNYFDNLTKITESNVLNNVNLFKLPLKEISEQNKTEWTKNSYEDIFKDISKIEAKIQLFNQNYIFKENKEENTKFTTLLKELNSKEINENNVDEILDDIKDSFTKQEINSLENNKAITTNLDKAKVTITKTIITPLNNITNPKKEKQNSTTFFDYLNDYYQEIDDNSTDYPIIDYVELYKDTTNEKVDYNPTESNISNSTDEDYIDNFIADTSNVISLVTPKVEDIPLKQDDIEDVVFPWVVAIFRRNETSNQFSYICDGALLTKRKILTAAQCVSETSSAFKPEDLLVFAGKRSLHKIDLNERVYKIKTILINDNYTFNENVIENNLAILGVAQEVEFNSQIHSFCLFESEYSGTILEEVTTAWNSNGSLVPVALKMINCTKKNESHDNIYSANYYKDVTGCPNYGGIYAVKINTNWYLKGIFNGDITKRAPFCTKQNFYYTSLSNYTDWFNEI